MSKVLSICIAVFNKWKFTESCLKDFSHLPNDHEIIIYDNGSSDETKAKLSYSTEVKYIRSDVNTGFGYANNRATELATGSHICFLNNDIKVRSDFSTWTKPIIENNNAVVGPTFGLLDSSFSFVKEANQKLTGNSYVSGWCLSAPRVIFDKLNISKNKVEIWDEKFFLYHEDADIGFRCRKLNIPMELIQIPVVHFGKTSSKQLNITKHFLDSKQVFTSKWKNK